jgi:autotransporter-associated beta strand protein
MKTDLIYTTLAALALALPAPARADTVVFPDGDYTDDIYLAARTDTFVVDGTATLSGRLYGTEVTSGNSHGIANGGSFIKTGAGTLTLTGSTNWFYGTSTVAAGALVVTHIGAIGSGNMVVRPGATLVFRDIAGAGNFPMSFTGGGALEIRDSDMTLNWRNSGVLNAPAAANHYFATLDLARSRLLALASGTLNGALGGAGAAITLRDRSTLALGREGVVAGVAGLLAPLAYETLAGGISVDATSTLVLHPGANLNITGTLALAGDPAAGGDTAPAARLTFAGAGVSRLEYAALSTPGAAPAAAGADPLAPFVSAPAGCSLETTAASVGGRQRRDYLVINQGANPMHDIAATAAAIETIADAAASRLNELFLLPATPPSKWRQSRRWANTAGARYFAASLDHAAAGAAPGHHGRLSGLLLALDSAWRQRVLLNLHAGITESSLTTTNATSLASHQRFFGAGITPRLGEKFYLTADLLAGTADSESLRRETSGGTLARWDNTFHGGGLEIGCLLRPWRDWFLRPRAALRYTRIAVNGYAERAPAGASALAVGDFSDTLARLTLAVEAARRFKIPVINREALATLSLSRKSSVREPRATLAASFADHPGRAFTLARGDYYEDAFAAGAALRLAITLRTRAGVSLDYERGARHDRLTANIIAGCIW